MSGIHHYHIDARGDQLRGPRQTRLAGTDRGPGAQTALFVLAGIREVAGLLDVLDRDHAAQLEVAVDHQQLLDAVLMQQVADEPAAGALLNRNQALLGRHNRGYRLIVAGLEAQVATGDDADQVIAVDHRHTGDALGPGQVHDLAHGRAGGDRERVGDDAALEFLDLAHLIRLLGGAEVLVHDTDATLLGQGDGQTALGDGVHRRRDQWNIEPDVARQRRPQVHISGHDVRIGRDQQHIIEGKCFLNDTHGMAPVRFWLG